MAPLYNAGEVLEMAIRIEQNAVAFYSKAATLNRQNSGFLLDLAAVEKEHVEEFLTLRGDLSEEERLEVLYDPNDEVAAYLRQFADGHGGEGSPQAADQLTPETRLSDVVAAGCILEEETIEFYQQLVRWVPERLGQGQVKRILEEERDHLQTLREKLRELTDLSEDRGN